MKIIADKSIVSNQGPVKPKLCVQISKEFETSLVPMRGMDFEDVGFKGPREIKHITINPEQGYYFISLGEDEYPDDNAAKAASESIKDMAGI